MQLNTFKSKTSRTPLRRVGRGGKRGKTSGHGHKGQSARAGHKIRPEVRDMIKKIPKRRGHGKNRSRTVRMDRLTLMPINLAALESAFAAGDTVNKETLVRAGVVKAVRGAAPRVKILGTGTLTKALTVSLPAVSAAAKAAIEKAGGSVIHG